MNFHLILYQETNSGVFVETNDVLVIGPTTISLPAITEGDTLLLPIKLIFKQIGNYKISAQIEKMQPKPLPEFSKKSKSIELDDIEKKQWFQPSIKMRVYE